MQSPALSPSCLRRLLCRNSGGTAFPLRAGLLLLALLTGCASPGPPQPPSLHLPEPARALRAERVGDQVVLTFTASNTTTDGDALRGPIVAVICRETPDAAQTAALSTAPPEKKPKAQVVKPPVAKPRKGTQPVPNLPVAPEPVKGPPCVPVQRLEVPRGPSRIVETLPRQLAAGAPALLGYRVELLNDHGRSDGPSPAVFTAAGAAPPPVGTIALTPGRDGVSARWETKPGMAAVELSRTLVAWEPGSAADPATPHRTSSKKTAPPIAPARKAATKATRTEESVRLAASTAGDAGGMIDTSVRDGGTYRYVAERVAHIEVGGRTLELHSEPSLPASIVFHDRFPPAEITGLVALPSAGATPSIDLSWEPDFDADLAGYNVYRAEGSAGGPPVKLTATPVAGPSYRDLKASPGVVYLYTVTAVDKLGNESKPSAAVRESLHKP